MFQIRKQRMAADWNVVRRRCVVDPECCANNVTFNPCGTPGSCVWTMPDTLYVTFTNYGFGLNQPNLPGYVLVNQTVPVHLRELSSLNAMERLRVGVTTPMWGIRGGGLGGTFDYTQDGNFTVPPFIPPPTGPGPTGAVKVGTTVGPNAQTPFAYVHDVYMAIYINAVCLAGPPPIGANDDLVLELFLLPYGIVRLTSAPFTVYRWGDPAVPLVVGLPSPPIGRTLPNGGDCLPEPALPVDFFSQSFAQITVSA